MKENIIKQKSFNFSIRIINLYKFLISQNEYIISKQLLRSGTSIGANIEEAIGGYSNKDFLSKITIAYKESRETNYWIRLLRATNYLTYKQYESINQDSETLIKILTKIIKSCKKFDY